MIFHGKYELIWYLSPLPAVPFSSSSILMASLKTATIPAIAPTSSASHISPFGTKPKEPRKTLKNKLRNSEQAIGKIEPGRVVAEKKYEIGQLIGRTERAMNNVFIKKKLQLTAFENRLGGLDPKSVLKRGYSITTNKNTGNVVTSSSDANVGDIVITELSSKEKLQSKVISTGKTKN